MNDFSNKFSVQEAMKYVNTPEGQQLISLLKQSNDSRLKDAMAMVAKGDTKGAAACLEGFTGSEQMQALLRQMGGK